MKKIILSMILAVSLMAFIGCNNGNNKADDDVTPAELLKNIPVTTTDLTNILNNQNRAGDSNNEEPDTSDLVLFVLKTLISETTGLEFGKNKTIGVISTFSDNARQEFIKVYGDEVDEYLENFSQRNFGSVRVDIDNDEATIFWYMPENVTTGMTFPECSIYINGTYKDGYYESIEIYGENYSYGTDSEGNFKAYPIYETKYVSESKAISKNVILKETTLTNNQVSKIEVTASGVTKSTESYSSDLPTQADIDGYHQKIQDWYKTVN